MKFRERKKSTRGLYWTYERALLAYRPYAQPVTLVSREKKLKGARDSRAAPGTGWEMHKKRTHSIAAALKFTNTRYITFNWPHNIAKVVNRIFLFRSTRKLHNIVTRCNKRCICAIISTFLCDWKGLFRCLMENIALPPCINPIYYLIVIDCSKRELFNAEWFYVSLIATALYSKDIHIQMLIYKKFIHVHEINLHFIRFHVSLHLSFAILI